MLAQCIYSDFSVQIEPTEVNVQGSIPAWLRGSYVRNGPGTFRGMKHLFDGYGMLVKFAFDSGKLQVSHRCLLLQEEGCSAADCL